MASVIKAGNATDGIAISSDNTGILELKTGTGAGTTAMTIGTDQSVTFAGAVSSSGNQTVTGNLTVNGNTTLGDANTDTILMTAAPSIGGAGLGMGFGFRNRIINGAMGISQRGTSFTTSLVSVTYTLDRWFAIVTGANVTVAQVAGIAGFQNALQITGAASNTQVYVSQRIESVNIADLAGTTATLSAVMQASTNNTVLWSAYYPNAKDNYSSFTFIASGTFSATTSAQTFSAQINLPAQAANGLWILFYPNNAGAFTSGTLTITGVQLEKGSTATSFDYRPYGTELALCQRYLPAWNTSSTNDPLGIGVAYSSTAANIFLSYQVQPRVSPTGITASAASSFYLLNATNGVAGTYASTTLYKASLNGVNIVSTTSAGLVAGNGTLLATNTGPAQILATGCEL